MTAGRYGSFTCVFQNVAEVAFGLHEALLFAFHSNLSTSLWNELAKGREALGSQTRLGEQKHQAIPFRTNPKQE